MSTAAIREEFLDLVRRDLLGPAGGDHEAVTEEKVRDRYLLGVLAPVKQTDELPSLEQLDELAEDGDDSPEEGTPEPSTPAATRNMTPSSFGLSFCLAAEASSFIIEARWGQYLRDRDADGKLIWKRHPRSGTSRPIQLTEGPLKPWTPDGDFLKVAVRGKVRRRDDHWSITLFLCNDQEEPAKGSREGKDPSWLFQAELKAHGDFTRRTGEAKLSTLDPSARLEDRMNEMLYRRELEFAAGHGVSVDWTVSTERPGRAVEVSTSTFPRETVRSVAAAEVPGLVIDMNTLANASDEELPGMLRPLIGEYRAWIDALVARRRSEPDLPGCNDATAEVIRQAEVALTRMQEGLATLESETVARDAFRFANRAMGWQRVRSVWIEEKKKNPQLNLADVDIPTNRSWRAFQLGFLLLNLAGLTQLDHPDRSVSEMAAADLLWFPTGGGKTEAYLGLAAYTLAIRRLQKGVGGRDGENGMAVLMRYTLRLLTLQQFQRASSLICACEVIRRRDIGKWGETPFRVGLWVGRKTTPNQTAQSLKAVEAMRGGQRPPAGIGSPRQLTACPWCGREISGGQHIQVDPYPGGRARTIIFCGDPMGTCEFSRKQAPEEGLPVVVVDEEIYQRPPSLLIATVDKFAQMAWTGEVQTLFGEVTGRCPRHGFRSPEIEDTNSHQTAGPNPPVQTQSCKKLRPPDLIIQDELHLISGPLGSLVGIYEGVIDHLATWEVDGKKVRPKVVASTATVRRAQAQVNALFMRDVRIFPPSGFEAGANVFSRELPVEEASPGRLYVGVCAPGKRLKAVLIRVYVATLAAGQTLYEKYGDAADPFLTAVGYFNSLRELGGMKRLVDDDVRTRLGQIGSRGLRPRKLYLPDAVEELTSRKSATEIPAVLDRMKLSFPPLGQPPRPGQKRPIDVLLATNMLSVGVDVGRLGLMIMAGQPKATAEYIQATSRVGRGTAGIVFTVYNWARPRDLSHYGSFRHYHATFYRQVEALSVTPYSAGAIEKALTGVLVSVLRQSGEVFNANAGAGMLTANHLLVSEALESLSERALQAGTRASLKQEVRAALQQRVDLWMQRKQSLRGGARLGYQRGNDGQTLALLQQPSVAGWTEFTVLNSLRDVEPGVELIFDDSGMDQAGGTS
jgi:Helicase conserved C-terminal domain